MLSWLGSVIVSLDIWQKATELVRRQQRIADYIEAVASGSG